MNIFERSTRAKLRFNSPIGDLSVEQLWDLPLTSTRGANLDDMAKKVNRSIKSAVEESFVDLEDTKPETSEAELRLEVLKHIIADKISRKKAAESRAAKAKEKERLLELLEKKQDARLEEMTEEEILAKLAEVK